jgi:hypothetical protein
MYGYFVQDSALAHVTNFSVTVPEGMWGQWLIINGLWAPRSPDLNLIVIVGDTER